MKYKFHIKNLSFDLEVEKLEDVAGKLEGKIASVIASEIGTNEELNREIDSIASTSKSFITLEEFDYDWEKAVQYTQNSDVSILLLQDGKKYRIKEYSRQKLKKNLFVVARNNAELVFGVDYYDQWDDESKIKQDKYLFDLGTWNSQVAFVNIDLTGAVNVNEVQPFFRCIFINSTEVGQTGIIALINSKTNMEFGLLYSGSDEDPLTVIQKDVSFKGIFWQELKANNGGGIQLVMEDCNLEQVDPPVYFEKKLIFSPDSVQLENGSFNQIENLFQGFGNSSNIIFVEGMTFLLPPTTYYKNYHNRYNQDTVERANHDSFHLIRHIPKRGEKFLMSRSYTDNGDLKADMLRNVINWERLGLPPQKNIVRELQAGDRISINGELYTIKVKDRLVGVNFASEYRLNGQDSYYTNEFKLDRDLPSSIPKVLEVEIIESRGEQLLDKQPRNGYLIFKYNKNWQTNTEIDHGLDYMLASNPFGVLSYNHVEISIWAKNVKHQGFYRQSKSGKGYSKGYTLINCTGFNDQFAPKVPVSDHGEMPPEASDFLTFLDQFILSKINV